LLLALRSAGTTSPRQDVLGANTTTTGHDDEHGHQDAPTIPSRPSLQQCTTGTGTACWLWSSREAGVQQAKTGLQRAAARGACWALWRMQATGDEGGGAWQDSHPPVVLRREGSERTWARDCFAASVASPGPRLPAAPGTGTGAGNHDWAGPRGSSPTGQAAACLEPVSVVTCALLRAKREITSLPTSPASPARSHLSSSPPPPAPAASARRPSALRGQLALLLPSPVASYIAALPRRSRPRRLSTTRRPSAGGPCAITSPLLFAAREPHGLDGFSPHCQAQRLPHCNQNTANHGER